MNKQEIIDMARQSHVVPYIVRPEDTEYLKRLEEFAKMVRDDYSKRHAQLWLKRIDAAVEEEREECAKICDRAEENWRKSWHSGAEKIVAQALADCGTFIRARRKND